MQQWASGRKPWSRQVAKWSSIFFHFYLLYLEGVGRGRDKHWFAVLLIHAFIDWFLCVPWLGSNPQPGRCDDTVTNCATWPGQVAMQTRKRLQKALWPLPSVWPSHNFLFPQTYQQQIYVSWECPLNLVHTHVLISLT